MVQTGFRGLCCPPNTSYPQAEPELDQSSSCPGPLGSPKDTQTVLHHDGLYLVPEHGIEQNLTKHLEEMIMHGAI